MYTCIYQYTRLLSKYALPNNHPPLFKQYLCYGDVKESN